MCEELSRSPVARVFLAAPKFFSISSATPLGFVTKSHSGPVSGTCFWHMHLNRRNRTREPGGVAILNFYKKQHRFWMPVGIIIHYNLTLMLILIEWVMICCPKADLKHCSQYVNLVRLRSSLVQFIRLIPQWELIFILMNLFTALVEIQPVEQFRLKV